jgi:hypothetical protein
MQDEQDFMMDETRFDEVNAGTAMLQVLEVCREVRRKNQLNPATLGSHVTDTDRLIALMYTPRKFPEYVQFTEDPNDPDCINVRISPAGLLERFVLPGDQYVSALGRHAAGFLDPGYNNIAYEGLELTRYNRSPPCADFKVVGRHRNIKDAVRHLLTRIVFNRLTPLPRDEDLYDPRLMVTSTGMHAALQAYEEVRALHPNGTAVLTRKNNMAGELNSLFFTLEGNAGYIVFESEKDVHKGMDIMVVPGELYVGRVMDIDQAVNAMMLRTGFLDPPLNTIRFDDAFYVPEMLGIEEGISISVYGRENIMAAVRLILTQIVFA